MRYFTIMLGLRGCYLPDTVYTVEADTVNALVNELLDAAGDDVSIQAVTDLAYDVWSLPNSSYPMVASFEENPAYGLFVANATETDYLENDQ